MGSGDGLECNWINRWTGNKDFDIPGQENGWMSARSTYPVVLVAMLRISRSNIPTEREVAGWEMGTGRRCETMMFVMSRCVIIELTYFTYLVTYLDIRF